MRQPRYWLAGVLVAICLAVSVNAQVVNQVVNTVAVGGITGLGTGVATLLAGNSSGTGGPAGTTSPTFTTPVLGAATATTINGAAVDNSAWDAYTPTCSSATGTITTCTTSGAWKAIGKTVWFSATATVTDNGTGATALRIGLPATASTAITVLGRNDSTGVAGQASIGAASALGSAVTTANAYPVVSGNVYTIMGVFQRQ